MLYLDGVNGARGWVSGYGGALWDNRLEVRVLLARNVLWAVGFLDAGSVWTTAGDIFPLSADPFFFSAGLGLRLTTPLVPLRLYLTKGFRIRDGVLSWKDERALNILGFTAGLVIAFGGDVF